MEQWQNTELKVMHAAAMQFENRSKVLNLKGVKLATQMEAFYEGALNVAVNAGLMTPERAGIINFMCSVGRLSELHAGWRDRTLFAAKAVRS